MARLSGKVAFITGAGHGQGRAHAIRLAEDGANIIAVDICHDIDGIPYPLATADELEETVRLVEKTGAKAIGLHGDVRSSADLDLAVQAGVEELGRIDILIANAGVWSLSQSSWTLDETTWQTMIDINLSGQWKTTKAVIPTMIAQGDGGAISLTSSSIGLKAVAGNVHYTSAKHGVIGLMRTLAHELAPHNIRVNAVCPTAVGTAMIKNDALYKLFRPDLEDPTFDDCAPGLEGLNIMPVATIEARDVSNAIAWLVSDEARWVTGITLPIDAGSTAK